MHVRWVLCFKDLQVVILERRPLCFHWYLNGFGVFAGKHAGSELVTRTTLGFLWSPRPRQRPPQREDSLDHFLDRRANWLRRPSAYFLGRQPLVSASDKLPQLSFSGGDWGGSEGQNNSRHKRLVRIHRGAAGGSRIVQFQQ